MTRRTSQSRSETRGAHVDAGRRMTRRLQAAWLCRREQTSRRATASCTAAETSPLRSSTLLAVYAKESSAVAEMGDRFATIDVGWKLGWLLCPFFLGGGDRTPSNTMWPVPRPTSVPSGILIHPTVWPQYTNVSIQTHRHRYRQRSDSIGRTVLQTVTKNH